MSKIHDRMTGDLPINSVVSIAIVDDPLERGASLKVLRSTRDDPLAAIYSRSQIDDAQFRAGRDAERLFEAAYIGRISGIDPGRIMVDGGQFPEVITDKQIKANREPVASWRALNATTPWPEGLSPARIE